MSLDLYITEKVPVPPEWAAKVEAAKAATLALYDMLGGLPEEVASSVRGAHFHAWEMSAAPETVLWKGNITGNLRWMAQAAGVDKALWFPEKLAPEGSECTARLLIAPLEAGWCWLKDNEAEAKAHSPENGWGTYDGLLRFIRNAVAACAQWPDGIVRAWR